MTITPQMIADRVWRFSRSSGEVISEAMRFRPDGTLAAACLTEQTWRVEDGQLLLLCDGIVTTRFSRLQLTAMGRMRLCGAFVLNPQALIYHYLDPIDSTAPAGESRLNITMSLSGETDTLLVIMNSAGRYSEGAETRWEFHDLPLSLGLDHVRIAESRSPTVFYTDKVKRLSAILRGVVGPRYKSVLFLGMSSGGYGSLLLSELLCAEFPKTRFSTVSINPQTGHSLRHRLYLAGSVALGTGPDLLDEHAFASRDTVETDIAAIVRCNEGRRSNLKHTIFYDSGNRAEVYYTGLVSGLPGFEVVPVGLGLPHMHSTVEIFNRGYAQTRVAALASRVEAFGSDAADFARPSLV